MMNLLNNILTEKDNTTHEVCRVSGFLGVISHIVLEGISIYHGAVFDAQSFGAGIAAIIGATGAAVWAKRDTECKPNQEGGV